VHLSPLEITIVVAVVAVLVAVLAVDVDLQGAAVTALKGDFLPPKTKGLDLKSGPFYFRRLVLRVPNAISERWR
jgi:hypothetical protein